MEPGNLHDEAAEGFGPLLRNLRTTRFPGQSRRAFAKAVGIDPSYLARIEAGVYPPPSADVVLRMADHLDVDRRRLLDAAEHFDPILGSVIKGSPERNRQLVDGLRKIQGSYYMAAPGVSPFADVIASSEAHLVRLLTSMGAGSILRALADLADRLADTPLDLGEYEKLQQVILRVLEDLPKQRVMINATKRPPMRKTSRVHSAQHEQVEKSSPK
jgi:transcriptional regulator with XRE-family HTH domain